MEGFVRNHRPLVKALVALAAFTGTVQAQNVQNFRPATGPWNYFSVESARVAPHLRFVPSLTINYGNQPLTERDPDDVIVRKIVEHMVTADVQFNFGLGDRFDLGLSVPISYVVAGEPEAGGVAEFEDGAAFGDVRLVPKIRLFGFDKQDDSGVGASISVPVDLPTGDDEKFFGAGQVELNPKLILEGRVIGFSFALNGGIKVRPDKKTRRRLPRRSRGQGRLRRRGRLPRSRQRPGRHPRHGTTPARNDPEDKDGFEDADGCPDPDNDKDGILDVDDKCPDEPETVNNFEDIDGCPDDPRHRRRRHPRQRRPVPRRPRRQGRLRGRGRLPRSRQRQATASSTSTTSAQRARDHQRRRRRRRLPRQQAGQGDQGEDRHQKVFSTSTRRPSRSPAASTS
jgi:hypothetical protein